MSIVSHYNILYLIESVITSTVQILTASFLPRETGRRQVKVTTFLLVPLLVSTLTHFNLQYLWRDERDVQSEDSDGGSMSVREDDDC